MGGWGRWLGRPRVGGWGDHEWVGGVGVLGDHEHVRQIFCLIIGYSSQSFSLVSALWWLTRYFKNILQYLLLFRKEMAWILTFFFLLCIINLFLVHCQSWAERQHCRDNVTMFSGHKIVGYCIMSIFVVATPVRHRDLTGTIFCIGSVKLHNIVGCRCREAQKLLRAQLCKLYNFFIING